MKLAATALLLFLIAAGLAATIVPRFLDRIYYRGPATDHFNGSRFFNPDGEDDTARPPAGGSRAGFLWRFLSGSDDRPPWPETVAVKPSVPERRVMGDRMVATWIGQNPLGRHIWPGLFTSRIGAPTRDYEPDEVLQQVSVTRSRPQATGHIHFSMVALTKNRKGISDQLRASRYTGQALVPATPWLGSTRPGTPTIKAVRGARSVDLSLTAGKGNALYAIWARHGNEWRFAVAPAARATWTVSDDERLGPAEIVVVSAVDRLGNEGERVRVWSKP